MRRLGSLSRKNVERDAVSGGDGGRGKSTKWGYCGNEKCISLLQGRGGGLCQK